MRSQFLPLILILSLISTCVEVDISVPSFPEIASYFKVPEGTIQLTIAFNFLGYCLSALFYGPLSESFGRRKIMIIGNAILFLGALGCVVAPSVNLLLLSRFIQGIGASTSVVLVFAIIADVYHGNQALKLIGILNSCLALVMAIAPIIGGVINQAVGWRGNYAVVAIISFITWVLLVLFLPETKQKIVKMQLKNVQKDYVQLLISVRFMCSSLAPSLLFAGYMVFISASPFLYIGRFGLNTISFVLHQVVIVASFAFVSMLSSRITSVLGARKVIKLGLFKCCVGSLMLFMLSFKMFDSAYAITGVMCIFCAGFAICYPIIFSESLEIFPSIKGTASSIIMSMRAFIVFIFTSLVSFSDSIEPFAVAIVILATTFLSVILISNLLSSKKLFEHAAT